MKAEKANIVSLCFVQLAFKFIRLGHHIVAICHYKRDVPVSIFKEDIDVSVHFYHTRNKISNIPR